MESKRITLGLIVSNRGFFPSHLCITGREKIIKALKKQNVNVVSLSLEETPQGSVENISDAEKCTDLFRKHRDEIDGLIVTLPNFGDESSTADVIRQSNLDVPVLVHAFPDIIDSMQSSDRRDSFCGKISLCNNLYQYGIKYTLTKQHTIDTDTKEFQLEIENFLAICRVCRGMKHPRIGLIGARPAAFKTVRFSEKILEHNGISVETLDLSELIFSFQNLDDKDKAVENKINEINNYLPNSGMPNIASVRLAKLGVVIDHWVAKQKLNAFTIQCWTSLQQNLGIVPCNIMSMMNNNLFPSACETDIPGSIAMYALSLASQKPSGIVDWNNNYGEDPNKCIVFHCSNLPKDILYKSNAKSNYCNTCITHHEILSGAFGKDNSWGVIRGRIRAGDYTFCRVSTDDLEGNMKAYIGQGEITQDSIDTFGGVGVFCIQNLQSLMQYICRNGFEHHVAINPGKTAVIINEVFTNYLGWKTHLISNSELDMQNK